MRSASPARTAPQPEINVTPLVDVVLVLLIIFMVIAPALQEGTPVTLPEATTVDPKARPEAIKVALTVDGGLTLDDAPIEREALFGALAAQRAQDPTRPIQLKADARLPYGEVRALFASLRSRGFAGVSLTVTERKET